MIDPTVRRLASCPGITSKHLDVWCEVRDRTAGTNRPLPIAELAAAARLSPLDVRRIVRHLERGGWLHREKRTAENGSPAPSRILCTIPLRPNTTSNVSRIMQQAPVVSLRAQD